MKPKSTRPGFIHVALDAIDLGQRKRPARNVEALVESIGEVGLLQPIAVTPENRLVAGRRRVAAYFAMGEKSIPAVVVSLQELDIELGEIDENLCRDELTVLERAEQLNRRKEIYEAKHPESKQHVAGANGSNRSQGKDATATMATASFASDTAVKTGSSPRSVRREVRIASDLDDRAKEIIRDTPVADSVTELERLARIEPKKQLAVARKIASKGLTVAQAQTAVQQDKRRAETIARAAAAPAGAVPWRLLAADCREAMAAEPRASADLVFADPPFNTGYAYNTYRDDLSDGDYLEFSREWITEVWHVLKPGGSFYLAIGDEYAADLCVIARRNLNFVLRNWIVWHYTFGQQPRAKFASSHTHILYLVKPPAEASTFNADAVRVASARQTTYGDKRANAAGKLPDDVWVLRPQEADGGFATDADTWHIPRVNGTFKEREGWHSCQMPQAVLDRIVLASSNPGDLVVDPFNGSGTTGKSAIKNGRRYLGIDIDPSYVADSELSLRALAAERSAAGSRGTRKEAS